MEADKTVPVQYVVNVIDIVNNVDKAGEAYTELYINVPTEVGGTPTILFDSISDANYQPSLKIQGKEVLNYSVLVVYIFP